MLGVGIAPIRSGLLAFVLACLCLALTPPASAQVKDVAPSFVVVTRDKADLRCGETSNHYKVLDLAAGTVLSLDGEAGEWARVSYPSGGTALVRAEHVRYDQAAGTATITNPNRLQAVNSLVGINGSWKALLPTPLPAGTVLKVTAPAKDDQGRVVAYHVVPPASARGYVRRADLRPATAAEIQSAQSSATPKSAPAPQNEAPRPGKTDDSPRPAAGPGDTKDAVEKATPVAVPETRNPPAPGSTLAEPMVKPGETPPPAPADTSEQPITGAPQTPGEAPPPSADASPVEPAIAPTVSAAPTLADLERTFDMLRRQSPDEAEYQALISEFRRFQDSLPAGQSRLRNQIQGRIDWMEMKLDVVDYQRKIEEMKRSADSQSRDVGSKLAELERQRQYAIVGRLLPSTVYDGTNLPLMYRLQSVTGGVVPRTIGYLKPDPALELPTKLNQVVGIIGEVKMDPGMTLNMITAQRVDILQSTDGGPVRNP